jgi:hypothetical protein
VHPFDGLAYIFRSTKLHIDMNPADDQHTLFNFDFSANICSQPATARIDLTRLQRAPEGSEHSPARRSDNVVQRCRVRLGQSCLINSIVFGDGAMHAEFDWIRLTGKLRNAERSLLPFDMNVGNVNDL